MCVVSQTTPLAMVICEGCVSKTHHNSQAHSDMDPESSEEVTASDVIVELSHVLSDKARKLRSFASRRGITSYI